MKRLTRRQFLRSSAVAGMVLTMAPSPVRHALFSRRRRRPKPRSSFNCLLDQVQQTVQDAQIPGIAVGVIRANKLVYADGFGVRNISTGAPMTSKSVMSMASISKGFTATALMQLIEARQVNGIDDTFLAYVPYFAMTDARYPVRSRFGICWRTPPACRRSQTRISSPSS